MIKKGFTILLLVILLSLNVYATDDVSIKIVDFNLTINDKDVDNNVQDYPFISYKNITYFPMTWDNANALGLRSKWNVDDGLSITSGHVVNEVKFSENANNKLGDIDQAKIAEFKIRVDGNLIDNKNEIYPLLTYKNVTYFPMTWKFMVENFGSKYIWSEEEGLSITADKYEPVVGTFNYIGVNDLDWQLVIPEGIDVNESNIILLTFFSSSLENDHYSSSYDERKEAIAFDALAYDTGCISISIVMLYNLIIFLSQMILFFKGLI